MKNDPGKKILVLCGLLLLMLACAAPVAKQTPLWKAPERQGSTAGQIDPPSGHTPAPQGAGGVNVVRTTIQPPTPRPTQKPASLSPAPAITATVTWTYNPAGRVMAPILLYHNITDELDNLYSIPVQEFRKQMQYLKDQGYHTIPISLLVKAITDGADLPENPVVITFDDGYETVYQNAYPILKEMGFTGVVYLIGKMLDEGYPYLTHDEITGLRDSGWEFGSHSMSHKYLTEYDQLWYEISTTRKMLSKYTGTDVMTFAYPFGLWDKIDQRATKETFAAGMGLGKSIVHTSDTLYYLSRIEVRQTTGFDGFTALLTPETGGQ